MEVKKRDRSVGEDFLFLIKGYWGENTQEWPDANTGEIERW